MTEPIFIALDLETTGLNKDSDQIIEVAAVKFSSNQTLETFTTLVNPQKPIPTVSTYITGITDEEVATAPTFAEIKDQLIEFIGDYPIIGHFIKFDIDFLIAKGIPLTNQSHDTFGLASMLIPHLPSYSLETITEYLDLPHQNKHRALDDTIAAMQLFLELQKIIAHTPQATLQQIQSVAQKSNWADRHFFISPLYSTKVNKPAINIPTTHLQSPKGLTPFQQLIDSQQQQVSILNSSHSKPGIITELLINNSSQSTLIVIPKIPKPSDFATLNLPIIHPQTNHLSATKINQLSQKPNFTDNETTIIIKSLLHFSHFSNPTFTNLKLTNEEKKLQKLICHDSENFEINDNPVQIISHYDFLKLQQNSPQSIAKFSTVVIIESETLPHSITKFNELNFNFENLHQQLTQLKELLATIDSSLTEDLDTLINENILSSGLIGIIFQQKASHQSYEKRLIITPEIRNSIEFQRAQQSFTNLHSQLSSTIKKLQQTTFPNEYTKIEINSSLQQIQAQTQKLQKIIDQPKNIQWIYNSRETFGLKSNQIITQFTPPTTKTILHSQALATEELATFLTNQLCLQPTTPYQNTSTSDYQTLTTFPNIASPTNKNFFPQAQEKITQLLAQEKGSSFVLLSSRKHVENFHHQHAFSFENHQLLTQSIGSIGKLTQKLIHQPQSTIILGNQHLWNQLANKNLSHLFNQLIIEKLPFEIPTLPTNKARLEQSPDSFNQISIPQCTIHLNKIISNTAKECQLFILDSRLINQKYGSTITTNLNPNLNIQQAT